MKDANQIAQEAARREPKTLRPNGVGTTMKPNRGNLLVWKDGDPREPSSLKFLDVTARLDTPGVIILGTERGATYLLYPEPGWYCEFIPNREGE